ncbi:MptD family putative ECF transporter S component, partial [Streptococcus salivarius]|uniref:MptD family putative ECF transporter S component n=1 Tax=Streptococcus salivarius TaxID=1304 RepID=UPI002CBAEA75
MINIGVFTAIYFVVVFAVAMRGMIPIFLVRLTVFVPLVGGVIFELFLTKVKKF